KTLNIITIGIMVPTLVVSIFSMNVAMPLNANHPISFWLIMGLALIALSAFFMLWKRKNDRLFHSRS
ncbi:MAG: LPXTG cell wall anchor domain-containing protein, partial [Lentisphaerae bacterium]|nr:LPXTG cell wall anchor domain-containing protein [Lentisphaerota bacterium]